LRAQTSVSHQMKQWLSESDGEAPWTPLRLATSSAGQVGAKTVMESDLKDILDNTTARVHTAGNNKAEREE
jgi:hypothetical protein